jgi:undecaprenyl-diphosphatase
VAIQLRPPDTAIRSVRRFDDAADRAFDHLRGHPISDRIFYGASELGNFSLIWYLVGGVQALTRPDPTATLSRYASLMGLESAVVNQGIKRLFHRGRPVHDAARPHKLRRPVTSSFPSGHASAAFLAASLLSEGSRMPPAYYALAVVVASSRSYVRIHHASDVVAGAALGVAFGAAARRWWPRDTAGPAARRSPR